MLTDLIACTNSADTHTEKGTVKERGTGSHHNDNNNSHNHSQSNSNSVQLGDEVGEELLLNAIAVCTNVTFYACKVRTCLNNVHV